MADKLIPTRIVNRNGVHTTVYRKPGHVQKSTTPIPPPASSVVSELSREELLEGLSLKIRTICREQYAGTNDVDQPTIQRTLTGYGTHTLRRLHDLLRDPSSSRAGSTPSVIGHAVARGEDEEFISDSMNFLREAGGRSSLVRSLRYYSQFQGFPVEAVEPDSENYKQAVALLNVADFIRRTYESNYREGQVLPYDTEKVSGMPSFHVLNDSRLVDLIFAHYADAEKINQIVEDHQSADYEVITAALKNGPALGSGTL